MTPPTIILDGRPVVGQCVPFAPKGNGNHRASSPGAIIGKLRGANPTEIEKTLDYIIQNGSCNTRFIRPLLDLLSSNDPVIFGKALTALTLMRENGVKFTADQEQAFTKRLNGAQIQFADGGLKITGNGVRLPNGAVLEKGSVCFKDGQWFVAEGDTAVISGVKIINEDCGTKWKADLFFDGKGHQESETYVSIDPNRGMLRIGSKAKFYGAVISLKKNNPFVPVDEKDDIRFEADRGMTLTIENRNKTGLIPKITVDTSSEQGYATINNGWFQAGISANGRVSISLGRGGYHDLNHQSTTSPFEIVLIDEAGNYKEFDVRNIQNALSTLRKEDQVAGKGYRIVFNNYSQVGILPLGKETKKTHINGFAPFIATISLAENIKEYAMQDFHALYPNIKLTGHIDSTNIKLTLDYLGSLPPEVRESIKGVDFPVKWEIAGNAYASYDGVIHLKRSSFDMPTFQHECAHILTFYYQNQLREDLNSAREADASYLATALNLASTFVQKIAGQSFESRWREVAGNVYGMYVNPATEHNINQGWKENVIDDGPRHGCVRSYGSSNFLEDVATFVQKIWEDSDLFKPLIDPKSSQRSLPYDPRYKQKLDLLLEFGFITQDRYDRVVSGPLKKINAFN